MQKALNRHARAAGGGSPAESTPQVQAPTHLPAAEEVGRALAATQAETRTMMTEVLYEFDHGALPDMFAVADAFAAAGGRSPDQLMRAAMLAGSIGKTIDVVKYFDQARSLLRTHMEEVPEPEEVSLWALSANSGIDVAKAQWMLTQIDRFAGNPGDFAKLVNKANLGEKYFKERERTVRSITDAMTEAALARRDAASLELAVEAARLVGDDELRAQVEGFDAKRVETLGRVLRALSYDPVCLAPKLGFSGDGVAVDAMRDIADDGLAWRAALLDTKHGREAEVEHLRVHGKHMSRGHNDGIGLRRSYELQSTAQMLLAVTHRLRVRKDAGVPMTESLRVHHQSKMQEMIDRFSQMPGRVRYRAVRDGEDWRTTKDLCIAATYDGVVEETGEPLEITVRMRVAESRQAKPEDQLKRIRQKLPSNYPEIEDGYWEVDGDALIPVLPGPTKLPPPPSAPLDVHIGTPPVCAHPDVAWGTPQGGTMVAATCTQCGDTLLKRPAPRLGNLGPSGERHRRDFPRLQALMCLAGEEPPLSLNELLTAPKCDDWRAELKAERENERDRERQKRRGRPMTIGEAMRRR